MKSEKIFRELKYDIKLIFKQTAV